MAPHCFSTTHVHLTFAHHNKIASFTIFKTLIMASFGDVPKISKMKKFSRKVPFPITL